MTNVHYNVFWIMGLSSSGKSTISEIILKNFPSFYLLDNDNFRKNYPNSFTREIRLLTCNDILMEAKELSKYHNVIVNKITPYEEIRKHNREVLGNHYYEIYCKCPIEILIQRDVKGLYKKALNGNLNNMIGISKEINDIYEEPINPDLVIDTTASLYDTEKLVVDFIKSRIG